MTVNHLNLTVTDVAATKAFLVAYFGLRENPGAKGNLGFAVLFDDAGMVVTLMKGKRAGVDYPSTFHIGFIQSSEAQVDEVYERLRGDGFECDPPSRSHAYTFYVKAPGGFDVEVLA